MSVIRTDRILLPHFEAIPPRTRTELLASVPDGYFVTITAGHRAQPGTADVRLIRESDGERIAEARGQSIAYMVRHVVSKAPGLVVTTDAGGWVESIEETA